MNNVIKASAYLILSGVLLGSLSCGSSGGGSGGTGGTSGSGGTSGTGGGGCSGSEVSLTVMNFDVWCTFEINGANKSAGASEQVCVPSGEVKLSATANPGFVLGTKPWNDVDSQSADGSATVKVTSGSKCVWVCCPGKGGSPACPTTDQCM